MLRFETRAKGAAAAVLCLLAILAPADSAFAHGVGWQADDAFAVVVRIQYDDGEPMAYGDVKVYSPATDQYAYQSGRSDRNGYFCFRPDEPGVWTFAGDDGQGHVTRGEMEVTEADLAGDANAESPPRPLARGGTQRPNPLQISLGLSILLNLALASLWLQAKRRRAAPGGAAGGGK